MRLIVAVDRNWAIGKDNDLLVSIPEDMKRFRDITMGAVVVMGRKTLESLPGGKPLPGRTNIVLTSHMDFDREGVITVNSLEELLKKISEYPPERVYCIGGGSVYNLLLPHCEYACITKIEYEFEADIFFTNLDRSPEWKLTEDEGVMHGGGYDYRFLTYERV